MPPNGVVILKLLSRTGYPFQRRFLERGIIFRTHESSSFVSSHFKLFKDRLLLKIRFNALRLHSLCMLQGGGGGGAEDFFSAARFFISPPPPRSIQIFIISPKQSAEK